jgi:hypothetical protein
MIRSTLSTFAKQTMGRVRRRTSTKQCSITLVVRNLRRRWGTKAKNDSSSGRSCAKRRTILAKGRRQRAWKARKVASARTLRGGNLYENKRNGLGWEMGIEPTTSGATVRCSAS